MEQRAQAVSANNDDDIAKLDAFFTKQDEVEGIEWSKWSEWSSSDPGDVQSRLQKRERTCNKTGLAEVDFRLVDDPGTVTVFSSQICLPPTRFAKETKEVFIPIVTMVSTSNLPNIVRNTEQNL